MTEFEPKPVDLATAAIPTEEETPSDPADVALPEPKPDDLVAFLTSRLPLAVVSIDKRATTGSRSTLCNVFDDIEHAMTWARERNDGGDHIYVVNNAPPAGWNPRNGNPPKENDILARARLQVDLDPAGEDHEAARKHALDVIAKMPLPPTSIVDSGRGIQAHWDLIEATANLSEAKSANEAMITWLRKTTSPLMVKVDGVANSNRMMRLPGCVNHKTGRVAAIISNCSNRRYSLAQFAAFSAAKPETSSSARPDEEPRHPNFADKLRGADPTPAQSDLLRELSCITLADLDQAPDLADLPTDLARMQARLGVRGRKDVRLSADGQAIRVPLSKTAYDPESRILSVWFVASGRHYEFEGVPPETYAAFRSAFVKGRFFNDHIRNHFRYRRISGDATS